MKVRQKYVKDYKDAFKKAGLLYWCEYLQKGWWYCVELM